MLFCRPGTLGTLQWLVGFKAGGRPAPSEGVRGLSGAASGAAGGEFSVTSSEQVWFLSSMLFVVIIWCILSV